ncbi:MAG: DUF4142 domain-containing protein [Pedobacter sp.]|nr:MAG: DUF4142 domain-containing protein [Pedobacter sp.]
MKKYILYLFPLVFAACSNDKANENKTNDNAIAANADTLLIKKDEATDLDTGSRFFLERAAYANMIQIESSNRLASKTTNNELKTYAEMLIADHKAVNAQLTQLAQSKGYELPSLLPESKMQLLHKMDELKDEGRNEYYVKLLINEQQHAIDAFALGSRSEDKEINNFATGSLPKLKQHYQQVLKIDTALQVPKANQGDDPLKISNRNKQVG